LHYIENVNESELPTRFDTDFPIIVNKLNTELTNLGFVVTTIEKEHKPSGIDVVTVTKECNVGDVKI